MRRARVAGDHEPLMAVPASVDRWLSELAAMPDFLELAGLELGADRAATPGPGGTFSLVEQAWHLADLEREGFGQRIDRLQQEERPHLPDFDGARIARERSYKSRALAEGLAAFRAARTRNLEALRHLPEDAWDCSGTQENVGPITLRDIPARMAEHDAGHREEIRALLESLGSRGKPPSPA